MKLFIVDDNPLVRKHSFALFKESYPEVELVGEAENVASAVEQINNLRPDVLLLDINLPDGMGFEVLDQMPHDLSPAVIVISAYDKYAIRAFRSGSVDFITKPIDPQEFNEAVAKVISFLERDDAYKKESLELLQQVLKQDRSKLPGKLALAHGQKISMVDINDIVALEADGRYTRFHIEGKTPLLVSRSLKEYDFLTESYTFERVHRSHIINMDKLVEFDFRDGGTVTLEGDLQVPVSSRLQADFVRKLRDQG